MLQAVIWAAWWAVIYHDTHISKQSVIISWLHYGIASAGVWSLIVTCCSNSPPVGLHYSLPCCVPDWLILSTYIFICNNFVCCCWRVLRDWMELSLCDCFVRCSVNPGLFHGKLWVCRFIYVYFDSISILMSFVCFDNIDTFLQFFFWRSHKLFCSSVYCAWQTHR